MIEHEGHVRVRDLLKIALEADEDDEEVEEPLDLEPEPAIDELATPKQ